MPYVVRYTYDQSAHSIDCCGNQGGTADIDFVPCWGWSFFVLWKFFEISIRVKNLEDGI